MFLDLGLVHGRDSRTTREPTNMGLSNEQEIAICRNIDTVEHVEIFPRRDMELNAVQSILYESDPTAPKLGDKWIN